jgi:excisionase family DNA binding protein
MSSQMTIITAMAEIKLLTLKEAALILKVSPQTVVRMVLKRDLPAFKVGAQYRINELALNDWIQGKAFEEASSSFHPLIGQQFPTTPCGPSETK